MHTILQIIMLDIKYSHIDAALNSYQPFMIVFLYSFVSLLQSSKNHLKIHI